MTVVPIRVGVLSAVARLVLGIMIRCVLGTVLVSVLVPVGGAVMLRLLIIISAGMSSVGS